MSKELCNSCHGSGEGMALASSSPKSAAEIVGPCSECCGTGFWQPHKSAMNPLLAKAMEAAVAALQECRGCDSPDCVDCCEHGDQDDYTCLDCGKEMTEDRMSAAFYRAKDIRKYGG